MDYRRVRPTAEYEYEYENAVNTQGLPWKVQAISEKRLESDKFLEA